jgi:hypothetical protein
MTDCLKEVVKTAKKYEGDHETQKAKTKNWLKWRFGWALGKEDIDVDVDSLDWEHNGDLNKVIQAITENYKDEKSYRELKKDLQKEVELAQKSGALYYDSPTEKDNEEYYQQLRDPEQAKIARWIIDEGYTETKIAKFLGISQPTVHRKKEKAFENLRQIAFKKNPWLKFKYSNLKRGDQ